MLTIKGRDIFLTQLSYMCKKGKLATIAKEDMFVLDPLCEMFQVPIELVEAFNAYYLDFMVDSNQLTNEEGTFYIAENVMAGIRDKFAYFYNPIIDLLSTKYPNLLIVATISPSLEDETTIIITVDNKPSKVLKQYARYSVVVPDHAQVPLVALNECRRANEPLLNFQDEPEELYGELEQLYDRILSVVIMAHRRQHIEPIEIGIYETVPDKPGFVRHVGNKSIKAVYQELLQRMKEDGIMPDESFSNTCRYDYANEDEPFPDYIWISCFAVTGSSEGNYIHIEVITENKRTLLFLGKTFHGMDYAYEVAKACAKYLGA